MNLFSKVVKAEILYFVQDDKKNASGVKALHLRQRLFAALRVTMGWSDIFNCFSSLFYKCAFLLCRSDEHLWRNSSSRRPRESASERRILINRKKTQSFLSNFSSCEGKVNWEASYKNIFLNSHYHRTFLRYCPV